MKPINIIQKLNEAVTDDSFDKFAKDLETNLRDAGYKVDIQFGGKNFENEDGMVYITVSSDEFEQNVYLYKGGNNISDFEEDTIGIGGDTAGKTVLPTVRDGWDWDDASPGVTKNLKTGDEVYVIFKPMKKTSIKEVIEIVNDSFERVVNEELKPMNTTKKLTEVVEDKTWEDRSGYNYINKNNFDEVGPSGNYVTVYTHDSIDEVKSILKELKRFFNDSAFDMAEIVHPDVEDVEMLKFCSEKISEIQAKIDEFLK